MHKITNLYRSITGFNLNSLKVIEEGLILQQPGYCNKNNKAVTTDSNESCIIVNITLFTEISYLM